MSDLVEFLLARIAEDEQMAQQNGVWLGGPTWWQMFETDPPVTCIGIDPRRVLAECEAKRRIIEEYRTAVGLHHGSTAIGHLERCLWMLALPYADHPDYRDEWAVQ